MLFWKYWLYFNPYFAFDSFLFQIPPEIFSAKSFSQFAIANGFDCKHNTQEGYHAIIFTFDFGLK